ncbi:MAG: hypothetical protein GTO17_11590 [Candidatus Aminicenantes bacterium]|nr:hypothetical protein [Candidatus Aminicenantes bacterium]
MYEKLETYLEEIDHYLALREGKEEILSEIKSHILEKVEQEFGEATEATLEKVIADYGSAQKVAEKYMDDFQIISPTFKKYLLRYTGILFAFHFGLTIISIIFGFSLFAFPFFFIPRMDTFQALFYIPMSLVYDFGLVGIFLYFVTQRKKEMKLPWLKIRLPVTDEYERKRPKIIWLILMLIGFGGLIYFYLRYQTLFLLNLNFEDPQSLFIPEASKWYSLALIVMLGCGIISYVIRFFTGSEWINLLRNAIYLIIIGIIINNPIEEAFVDFPYLDIKTLGTVVIIILAIIFAIGFIKSLIVIWNRAWVGK